MNIELTEEEIKRYRKEWVDAWTKVPETGFGIGNGPLRLMQDKNPKQKFFLFEINRFPRKIGVYAPCKEVFFGWYSDNHLDKDKSFQMAYPEELSYDFTGKLLMDEYKLWKEKVLKGIEQKVKWY